MVALVFAVGGGAAFAALSPLGSDGTIHACYAPKRGTLLMKTASTCRTGWTPIAWSQGGAAGANGAQGSAGANGAQGSAGAKGDNGSRGPTGPTGPAGPAGSPGANGHDGHNGAQGPSGVTGSGAAQQQNGQQPGKTDTTIIDLAAGSGQITVDRKSRFIATATMALLVPATMDGTATCYPAISDGTGPNNGLTPMSNPIGANVRGFPALPGSSSLSVTGDAVKLPGTYDVQVLCSTVGAAIVRGTLTVIAAAV